jgi:hypothetical protein
MWQSWGFSQLDSRRGKSVNASESLRLMEWSIPAAAGGELFVGSGHRVRWNRGYDFCRTNSGVTARQWSDCWRSTNPCWSGVGHQCMCKYPRKRRDDWQKPASRGSIAESLALSEAPVSREDIRAMERQRTTPDIPARNVPRPATSRGPRAWGR